MHPLISLFFDAQSRIPFSANLQLYGVATDEHSISDCEIVFAWMSWVGCAGYQGLFNVGDQHISRHLLVRMKLFKSDKNARKYCMEIVIHCLYFAYLLFSWLWRFFQVLFSWGIIATGVHFNGSAIDERNGDIGENATILMAVFTKAVIKQWNVTDNLFKSSCVWNTKMAKYKVFSLTPLKSLVSFWYRKCVFNKISWQIRLKFGIQFERTNF